MKDVEINSSIDNYESGWRSPGPLTATVSLDSLTGLLVVRVTSELYEEFDRSSDPLLAYRAALESSAELKRLLTSENGDKGLPCSLPGQDSSKTRLSFFYALDSAGASIDPAKEKYTER